MNTSWVQPTVWANGHRSESMNLFFFYWTIIAEWPIIVLAILISLYRDWFNGLVVGLFYSVEGILVNLLKSSINAARPLQEAANLVSINGNQILSWHSMPSGHTTAAFMGFGFISMHFNNKYIGAISAILAALVGYSRLYLGQHYLRDVLAGESIALMILFVFIKSLPKFQKWRPNPK